MLHARPFLVELVVAAAIHLGFATATLAAGLTAGEVADFYVKTAFGTELSVNPILEGKVVRRFDLEEPIKVILFGGRVLTAQQVEQTRGQMVHVIDDLAQHGADIKFDIYTDARLIPYLVQDSNFIELISSGAILVYVQTEQELVAMVDRLGDASALGRLLSPFKPGGSAEGLPICFGYINSASTDSPIVTTGTVIAEYDASELETCFYEELMQVFGITDDFPAGTASIFNDDRVYSAPTELDWLLWAIHTDERIRPGMNREQAWKAAESIAREMLASTDQ